MAEKLKISNQIESDGVGYATYEDEIGYKPNRSKKIGKKTLDAIGRFQAKKMTIF